MREKIPTRPERKVTSAICVRREKHTHTHTQARSKHLPPHKPFQPQFLRHPKVFGSGTAESRRRGIDVIASLPLTSSRSVSETFGTRLAAEKPISATARALSKPRLGERGNCLSFFFSRH